MCVWVCALCLVFVTANTVHCQHDVCPLDPTTTQPLPPSLIPSSPPSHCRQTLQLHQQQFCENRAHKLLHLLRRIVSLMVPLFDSLTSTSVSLTCLEWRCQASLMRPHRPWHGAKRFARPPPHHQQVARHLFRCAMWGPGSEPDSPYTSASAAILDGAVSICERHQRRCQGAFTRSGKVEAVKYFKTTLMLISG